MWAAQAFHCDFASGIAPYFPTLGGVLSQGEGGSGFFTNFPCCMAFVEGLRRPFFFNSKELSPCQSQKEISTSKK
jgi:hypothetical protein